MRVPLIYRKRPLFGLDIGSHSAKFVQLKKTGGHVRVAGYGYASYAADAIVEGIISDPEPIATAIKEALRHPQVGIISSRRAVVSIPNSKLFTRTLELPAMDQADLLQAVNFEAEQYVPVPLNDLYIDYEVLGRSKNDKGEDHIEVLMVAAPRAVVDSYMKLFGLVGLELDAIEGSLRAIMRSMRPLAPATRPTLVVDIGSTSTDLALYDPAPRVTGTFDIGGDHLTKTLVKALDVKADQALEIKHKFGINSSDMQAKVFKALAPQLEIIANEIKKALKFYHERGKVTAANDKTSAKDKKAPALQTETLVLTGGTANMPGLADYLNQQAKVPVVVGDPWMDLTFGPLAEPEDAETIAYATAIGLALRGIRP